MLRKHPDIGPARHDEAAGIAAVHVAAWRAAYAGLLLPGDLGEGPDAAERERRWLRILAAADGRLTETFVVRRLGRVAGFCAIGPQRSASLAADGWAGEVRALYLHPRAQRRGLGRLLMQVAAARMLDHGTARAALWVLAENRAARGFYEALGGLPVARRDDRRAGGVLTEIAYGWPDLTLLL